MPFEVLVLNSGEWSLAEELPAEPWHILIYRHRLESRNELHVWLPRQGMRGSGEYAFRRYWVEGRTRWCVELPRDPDRLRGTRAEGEAEALLTVFREVQGEMAPPGAVVVAPVALVKRLKLRQFMLVVDGVQFPGLCRATQRTD